MHSLNASYCNLLSVLYVIAIEVAIVVDSLAPEKAVRWHPQRITANQGDSLSVSCLVPGLDILSVVRVERRDEDKQTRMVLADNGDVKPPFAGNRRYRVEFDQLGSVGNVTIHYNQIRGEDAGSLVCYKLEMTPDETDAAVFELKVLVPVQSVQISTLSSDGVEQMVDKDDHESPGLHNIDPVVTLTEVTMTSEVARPDGVTCVASVNGSLTPPTVYLAIDNRDVTAQFIITEQSRIIEETETGTSGGGGRLGFYYGEKRLTYSASSPDATWNGKTLTCAASQEGFPDTFATAMIIVKYIPQITCLSHDIDAQVGESFRITCTLKANPQAKVTWFSVDRNKTVGGETNDEVDTTLKARGRDDEYEVSFYMAKTDPTWLGEYRLTASNSIGVGEETVRVRERRDRSTSVVLDQDSFHRSRDDQQPIIGGQAAPSVSSAIALHRKQCSTSVMFGALWAAIHLLTSSTRRPFKS